MSTPHPSRAGDTRSATERRGPRRAPRTFPVRATAIAVLLAMVAALVGAGPAAADLPVGSDQDVAGPTIESLSVSPTAVDVRAQAAQLTATAHLKDDLSGVEGVTVTYASPSGAQWMAFTFGPYNRTGGTALDGTHAAGLTVDSQREAGVWKPSGASTRDVVGNVRGYTAAQVAALGAPDVTVTSDRDAVSPHLTAIRYAPAPVDVGSGDGSPVFDFDATDEGGSGVHVVVLSLRSPSGRQTMVAQAGDWHLVAGTVGAGTFRGAGMTSTATPTGNFFEDGLSRYSEPGTWTVNFAQVYDRARNVRTYSAADAAALMATAFVVASDPTDTTAPDLRSFRFSPASIDVTSAAKAVDVELDVGDDLSGVQAAWVTFRSPTIAASPPFLARSAVHSTYLSAPRLLNGTVRASVTFPVYDRSGDWAVSEACVVDRVKWRRCYTGADLARLGPTTVTVVANEAPVVRVTGVEDGAVYPEGQVPQAACDVRDREDGVLVDVQPTVTGPDADGAFRATCTATDSGGKTGTHTVSYTVERVTDPDSDGDGLTDVVEIWLGCDPHDADSDDDGLGDWVEIMVGTDPSVVDTDGDPAEHGDGAWLATYLSARCGCTPPPADADGNGNGVPDVVEYFYFGGLYDPATHGGGGYASLTEYLHHLCGCGPDDPDGNGIPQAAEHHFGGGYLLRIVHACGCLPWEDASGGGGLSIEFRTAIGAAADVDSDGDGLIDVIEILLGCNPHDADTDGDGLSDRDELLVHRTNPLEQDTDGDGLLDKREIELGCDPNDADSDDDGTRDGDDPAPRGTVASCGPSTDGTVVPVGTAVPASATFTGYDGGVAGGRLDWGDGSAPAVRSGEGAITATHTYSAAGVYVLTCTVTDTTGGTQATEYRYVVVYDPGAGFVTGGGWIDSPAGALTADPSVVGRASFGFVSKYLKGAAVPSGNTEFQFKAAGLNFASSSYEWLVVSGARAQYKGSGTVNGVAGYGFLLTVTDGQAKGGGGVDRFRMKITSGDTLVYDNLLGSSDDIGGGQPLGSGSIVIHG